MACTWYPGVVVVPVLVQLLRVEVRWEVCPVGGGGGGVVGGGVVRVLGPRQLVDAGRRAAVRRGARLRGGRDDAQRSVETWTWRSWRSHNSTLTLQLRRMMSCDSE